MTDKKPQEGSTEAALSALVTRGSSAQSAMDILQEAMKALENDCYQKFRDSQIADDEGRKNCRMYLGVLDDLRTYFATAIRDGKTAKTNLKTKRKLFSINRT